jgi:hypothetical protein
MKACEHLIVTAHLIPDREAPRWHPWLVNSKQLPEPIRALPLAAFIQQLEQEGWDLVKSPSIRTAGTPAAQTWLFKRPKPQEPGCES